VGSWVAVLLPAVAVALVVRLDARMVGPYFALSELVPGYSGLDAHFFYVARKLNLALVRRFAYPAITAAILGAFGYPLVDALAAVGVGACLLLWPVVFHGLPRGVSRRDWEVPAIYGLMLVGFLGAGASGYYAVDWMRFLGDGSARDFLVQSGGEALFWFLVGVLATAFMRPVSERLGEKKEVRADQAAKLGYEGDPADFVSGELDDKAK
jgi:hypothetical protein